MESVIQQFNFQDKQPIRAFERDGEAWFVAADVCSALDQPNVSQVVSRLEDDERAIHNVDTPYGPQRMLVVNEPGLYSLILTSRKEEAKAFKRWITHEVIPAIRKTGAYIEPAITPTEALLVAVQRMVETEREVAALKEGQAEHDQRLADIEHRQTAMEEGSQYFSIIAFANRLGRKVSTEQARSLGRYAGRYSRKHGYPIGQAPDARYGHVNTYHAEVLRAVFGVAEQ